MHMYIYNNNTEEATQKSQRNIIDKMTVNKLH